MVVDENFLIIVTQVFINNEVYTLEYVYFDEIYTNFVQNYYSFLQIFGLEHFCFNLLKYICPPLFNTVNVTYTWFEIQIVSKIMITP